MTDLIDKIDIKTFIGDLEKEDPPKSIDEIYAEVGEFPFTVRKVGPPNERSRGPTGVECTVTGNLGYTFTIEPLGDYSHVFPGIKVWQLLGHK